MKKSFGLGFVLILTAINILAQTDTTRPPSTGAHVIVTNTIPVPSSTPLTAPVQRPAQTFPVVSTSKEVSEASNLTYKGLSFAQIKNKIAEAKRQMQTRPITTASVEPMLLTSLVRIAFYDWKLQQVDYIVVSKDQFLTPNSPATSTSTRGKQMTLRTIRANGVNTPVSITDDNGQPQLPLLIQYPVEKNGRFVETAYYMSTHPGIVTPEVVSAGRFYVHNVIEIARDRLRERGISIQPKVADIAERLATVEHVDHLRFRTEFQPNIYNDIFTLYALNEGQTYRYSISSAGAGGMVQMIPSTYAMIRSRYTSVGLMPDFVEGMRNHVNATEAMLLYMQMTWNDLSASPTITGAIQSGIATQEHLMAAGYNSNPAKLAGYINRGADRWTTLIPRETQIYLQIWDSLERAVNLTPRKL
ncbi:MAG: hypothetical protein ABJA02_16485 [Acidobacteriota bacterium]